MRPTTQMEACSLKLIVEPMTHTQVSASSEIHWGAHGTHKSGFMLYEVDGGVHHSIFYLEHIDHDGEPKDFFSQGLWGKLPQRTLSTHLIECLTDSLDTGQTEDGFFNLKSFKEQRGSDSLSDPEYLGNGHTLLLEWKHGEITWEPFTNIMAHVKHYENFNAKFSTDGNHTEESTETVYSGVVSLRNLRLAMFVAELNNI